MVRDQRPRRQPARLRSARAGRGPVTARQRDLITAVVFLLPSVLVFGVFTHFGLVYNLYISLMNWKFTGGANRWVGLENYGNFFSSSAFAVVFRNTVYYSIVTVIAALVLGLVLALLLDRPLHGRAFARTILFAPYVTTLLVLAPILALFLVAQKQFVRSAIRSGLTGM